MYVICIYIYIYYDIIEYGPLISCRSAESSSWVSHGMCLAIWSWQLMIQIIILIYTTNKILKYTNNNTDMY